MILERVQSGKFEDRLAEGGERAVRREQPVAALARVVGGESEMICNGAGHESREHEPGNFFFMQGFGDPAQEKERGADGGYVGEGLAEGKLPGQEGRGLADVIRRGHQDAAECAVDFTACAGNSGHDDGDAGGGISEEKVAGPGGCGGDLFALVGGGDPFASSFLGTGCEGVDGDAGLESLEEGLLCGHSTVESGEEDCGREGQGFDGG